MELSLISTQHCHIHVVDDKKVAVFLSVVGGKTYFLLWDLLAPESLRTSHYQCCSKAEGTLRTQAVSHRTEKYKLANMHLLSIMHLASCEYSDITNRPTGKEFIVSQTVNVSLYSKHCITTSAQDWGSYLLFRRIR